MPDEQRGAADHRMNRERVPDLVSHRAGRVVAEVGSVLTAVNTDHPVAVNQARSGLAPAGAIVKTGPEDDDRRSGPLVVCADIDTVTCRRYDTESLLSRHVLQPLVRAAVTTTVV